jgi:hypothetical protein
MICVISDELHRELEIPRCDWLNIAEIFRSLGRACP